MDKNIFREYAKICHNLLVFWNAFIEHCIDCPQSWEGEDFLKRRPSFFFYEKGHNSGTKSQKIVPKVGNEATLLNQAKIGPLNKMGVVWQKDIPGKKNLILTMF